MKRFYAVKISIYVKGKNFKGEDIFVKKNDEKSSSLFSYCDTEKIFLAQVRDREDLRFLELERNLKKTFFTRQNYIVIDGKRIFSPAFVSIRTPIDKKNVFKSANVSIL